MARVEKTNTPELLKAYIEKKAGPDFRQMRRMLRRIIDGKAVEAKLIKVKVAIRNGDKVSERVVDMIYQVPPTNRDVISASKALKELLLDKIVADVKDTQKVEHEFSMTEALEEVARKKQAAKAEAEAEAEAAGKLAKIGGSDAGG